MQTTSSFAARAVPQRHFEGHDLALRPDSHQRARLLLGVAAIDGRERQGAPGAARARLRERGMGRR